MTRIIDLSKIETTETVYLSVNEDIAGFCIDMRLGTEQDHEADHSWLVNKVAAEQLIEEGGWQIGNDIVHTGPYRILIYSKDDPDGEEFEDFDCPTWSVALEKMRDIEDRKLHGEISWYEVVGACNDTVYTWEYVENVQTNTRAGMYIRMFGRVHHSPDKDGLEQNEIVIGPFNQAICNQHVIVLKFPDADAIRPFLWIAARYVEPTEETLELRLGMFLGNVRVGREEFKSWTIYLQEGQDGNT